MGSFANSAFSIILGWIRSAVSGLWNMIFAAESSDFITWIGDNWLGLVIALCAVCTAVDVVIHLIRWRPMQVWASFFRRLGQKEKEHEPVPDTPVATVRREWYYPDGSARAEEIRMSEEEAYAHQPDWAQPRKARPSSAGMSQRYVRSFARPEEQVHPSVANKPMEYEDYPVAPLPGQEMMQSAETEQVPEEPMQEETAPMSRSRRVLQRMAKLPKNFVLMDDDDDLQLKFQPAPPALDKEQAYHAPVYPASWRYTAEQQEERKS